MTSDPFYVILGFGVLAFVTYFVGLYQGFKMGQQSVDDRLREKSQRHGSDVPPQKALYD